MTRYLFTARPFRPPFPPLCFPLLLFRVPVLLFRVSVLHFGVWDIFKGTKKKKMDRLQLQTFERFSFDILYQS